MALLSGQIISADLSPNAGIQGIQIADSTIQTRNIAPGAILSSMIVNDGYIFKVIGTYTATIGSNTIGAGNVTDTATVDISALGLTTTPLIFAFYTTGATAVSLGRSPWGGTVIEFIGGVGTLNAFSILSTNHSNTTASFSRKFVNNSGGSLTVPQYNIKFVVLPITS